MTKDEHRRLVKAMGFFLDEDPDKWTDGIDELCLLAFGRRWSEKLRGGKTISIYELFKGKEGK